MDRGGAKSTGQRLEAAVGLNASPELTTGMPTVPRTDQDWAK